MSPTPAKRLTRKTVPEPHPEPLALVVPSSTDNEPDGTPAPEHAEPEQSTEDTAEVLGYERPEFMDDIYVAVNDYAVSAAPESSLLQVLAAITVGLDRLTNVVGIVAQQQQWASDQVAIMKQEFDGFMGNGNPLAMVSKMFGRNKGRAETHGG